MIKGLYTSASSMLATKRNLDIISNNLANANTTGYKKEDGIKESFPEMLLKRVEKGKLDKNIGSLGTGVRLEQSYTDFQAGSLKATGNSLDFALKGDGFFVVQTEAGKRYTRNGNFNLNQENQIVTQAGYPVLDNNDQPVIVENGQQIHIDAQGRVLSGSTDDVSLQIVDFENRELLEKQGENLYLNNGEADTEIEANNVQLVQGYLESSNVKIVQEMAKMIETNRLYEANQKVIQSIDNTLDQAVNQVGQVR